MTVIEELYNLLQAAEGCDQTGDYDRRYGWIILAMAKAHTIGLRVGVRIDPKEPDWPVVFIELPTGQVSWHMPPHAREWDGHTTEEKYARIREFGKRIGRA